MASSNFADLKGPLAKALSLVAQAGPANALALVWAEAVGPFLAKHSRPVRLHRGSLTVEANPEFLGELESVRIDICKRLNSRLGRESVQKLYLISKRMLRP